MLKKGELYYPDKDFQKKAWINNKKIYQQAEKDPVKFWEKLAGELFWFKKWQKGFLHNPPYFQWFVGGKINITENIFRHLSDKPALIWEPEPVNEEPKILTYQELFKSVNQLANALKILGVKKGDGVGIYLPMIPEAVISMLACCRIGAVHTVVFSAFSPSALRVRLQDTKAKVLITADGYFRRGQVINLKQNADEGIKETNIEKVIVVKRTGNEITWDNQKDLWWEELLQKQSQECQAEQMDSEDAMFILYTSGSTGQPKGIVHACGGYAVQAYWTGKWIFDFHQDDIFWCTSDQGWITGHTYTIYSPLLNGITTLMFEGAPDFPTPDRWAQIIEKRKVSIFYTAPTAIRMFEKYGAHHIEKYKFESLRLLGSVGEPIDTAAWLWYSKNIGKEKCPIVDTWWQTETGAILLSSLPGIGPFKPAFTGLPFPGIKVDILDKQGKAVSEGEEGRLVILPPFCPSLLRGVYKNPEKYLKTYWSQYGNKVYFTSDSALKDKNGLIRIVGRLDDVIKIAGHRVTTGEMEAAVNLHPEITECAVIGIPDEIKGEVPVIFIVTWSKKPLDKIKEEVVGWIKKEIGPIALPKEIYSVNDLPKTRSGKIMRRILRKLVTQAAAKGEKEDLSSLPSGEDLGDLSTLANPQSVDDIKNMINQ
ncbi:MAG: acetate--CoA ligase [Candidatus Nealsonbacteria bacterium]|nr:acetate--CoA ligase [Candidatus Nealsonbacteria bacterium]